MFNFFNSRFSLYALNPTNPKIIINPPYAKIELYSINTADTPVPKRPGSKESAYNHQPQHPNGTSEKNEKKDVAAALLVFPPNDFFFNEHPNCLLFSETNT